MRFGQDKRNPYKHQVVKVPDDIEFATVELCTFKGAPAFLGTTLVTLHYGNNQEITLNSKMSGVVNQILVDNGEIVKSGQELVELRNININRDKEGHKMHPAKNPTPNGLFSKKKKASQRKELENKYQIQIRLK